MAIANARPAAARLSLTLLRPESIQRQRLIEKLQAATRKPLTVVCAPAGYGKTTVLVQWIERCSVPHAWLSLDASENDPHGFAAALLTALERASPGRHSTAEQALQAGADLGESVISLARDALAEHPGERLTIVLDDYHLISNPSCHQLTADLIAAASPQLGVVVASRTEPPLRLAWRRAAGELGEVGVQELRFAVEESEQLLNGTLALGLEPGELELLDERVQGWAAGLALTATALRGQRDRSGLLDAAAASRASLDAYLTDEVLHAARPELGDFLRRTSILGRLSAPLCEAVLDDPRARELLEEVRRVNLFVTALESEGEWLRYHHLFAETLAGGLERSEPELVPELHRRASDWFEQAAMPEEAIEHALAAGDGPRAATLLAGCWPALINDRRHATLRRMLDRLPDERGEFEPLCEALDLLCMTHEGVDQRLAAEHANALAARHGNDPQVRLLLDGILISPFYGDVGRAVELGREAWERYAELPDVQEQIAVQFALVLWFAGDNDEVRRLLEPRVCVEQPTPTKVWTLVILALTAADDQDGQLAERNAREAMAAVEAIDGQTATEFTAVPWALAEALRVNGKLDDAGHYLSLGLENEAHRPGSVGHALALTYDAQLALSMRDRRRASTSARRAREIVDRYRDVGTLETRLASVESTLEDHEANRRPGTRPTRTELRVLALLDSDRTFTEIADQLGVSPNTVKSHVQRLYRHLGARTREGALAAARERGLLDEQ